MYQIKKKRSGQGLLEYIALSALVAIVCIGTVKTLGSRVKTHLTRVSNTFDRTVRTGLSPGRNTGNDTDDDSPSGNESPAGGSRDRGIRLPFPL